MPHIQTDNQPVTQITVIEPEGAGPAYCTRTTEHRYEACADVAVQRGERRGGRGFDRFVYECLTGTIGTAPQAERRIECSFELSAISGVLERELPASTGIGSLATLAYAIESPAPIMYC